MGSVQQPRGHDGNSLAGLVEQHEIEQDGISFARIECLVNETLKQQDEEEYERQRMKASVAARLLNDADPMHMDTRVPEGVQGADPTLTNTLALRYGVRLMKEAEHPFAKERRLYAVKNNMDDVFLLWRTAQERDQQLMKRTSNLIHTEGALQKAHFSGRPLQHKRGEGDDKTCSEVSEAGRIQHQNRQYDICDGEKWEAELDKKLANIDLWDWSELDERPKHLQALLDDTEINYLVELQQEIDKKSAALARKTSELNALRIRSQLPVWTHRRSRIQPMIWARPTGTRARASRRKWLKGEETELSKDLASNPVGGFLQALVDDSKVSHHDDTKINQDESGEIVELETVEQESCPTRADNDFINPSNRQSEPMLLSQTPQVTAARPKQSQDDCCRRTDLVDPVIPTS